MEKSYLIMRKMRAVNPYGPQVFFNSPTNPNFDMIKVGANVIMEMELEGEIRFIGFGTIDSIEPNQFARSYRKGEMRVGISNFKKFFPPRKKNYKIREALRTVPGFYWNDTVRPITKEIYDTILDFCGKEIQDLPTERPDNPSEVDPLLSLFYKDESVDLEFKSTMRSPIEKSKSTIALERKIDSAEDEKEKKKAKNELNDHLRNLPQELGRSIVKTIAAFSNSIKGGTLIVGIDDWGRPIGLQSDYLTLGERKDWDGWVQALRNLVINSLGVGIATSIDLDPLETRGATVAVLKVPFSNEPVFYKWKDKDGVDQEEFFVRVFNTTTKLSPIEQNKYIKSTWK